MEINNLSGQVSLSEVSQKGQVSLSELSLSELSDNELNAIRGGLVQDELGVRVRSLLEIDYVIFDSILD